MVSVRTFGRNNIGWNLWAEWSTASWVLPEWNFKNPQLLGWDLDRASKVFGLLDEISKGFGSPASGQKNFEGSISHLKELRRPQLPFERTSKVPGSHLAHFKDPGISCQTFRK
ncbi:unnamed protein product [Rhizophagus irregularis]|nr:unnamed protein product [Rhizophagus irregularis]